MSRLGGRCSFTWGGPHKPEQVGDVTELGLTENRLREREAA